MSRYLVWVLAAGCTGGSKTDDTADSSGTPAGGACELAASHQTCPSCYDGPYMCVYGDTAVTTTSCGDCQARSLLYQALCDQGEAASAAAIEQNAVCSPVTCVARWDCSCNPECVQTSDVYAAADMAPECTSTTCTGTFPGSCGWTSDGCDWALDTGNP